MIDILAAFGLSSSAGFNAYLPILITGLLARYTDLLTLAEPWDALEEPWVLLVIAVLLLVEITADKIPIVDTLNDVVQSLVRPAAGAVLFAASSNAISDLNTGLALVFGLLVAGGVHTAKTVARPVITATTAGAGRPFPRCRRSSLSRPCSRRSRSSSASRRS